MLRYTFALLLSFSSCLFAEKEAVFTVPDGQAGFYSVTESSIRAAKDLPGSSEFHVYCRKMGKTEEPAVLTTLSAGEFCDFNVFLGYLREGDAVFIEEGKGLTAEYKITPTTSIPVTSLPADSKNWSLLTNVPAGSQSARWLARGKNEGKFQVTETAARIQLPDNSAGKDTIASFQAPQSGYYALHNASASLRSNGGDAEVRLYIGMNEKPQAVFTLANDRAASLNCELGYLPRGTFLYLATSAATGGTLDLAGSLVEWAPRRAPLRVRRGTDGYLDVYEPSAPDRTVDIPAERWITVAPGKGDVTAAIREALEKAKASQQPGQYSGIRLEAGKTYVVGTAQKGGRLFDLKECERLIFDGNGATLQVDSAELPREGIDLFTTSNCRSIAFADLIVESKYQGFTIGEILEVSPPVDDKRTITFRVDPGSPDPVRDIRRDGQANAYVYDLKIPGRPAEGTWSHYPGAGEVQLQAEERPGIFRNTVTRSDGLTSQGKLLVKNKKAGIIYLTTRGTSEDITLSGIDCRAAGGGLLRNWQTSAINILNCRFEPEGNAWISSTADGIHGRGREGVWVENTLIRGICEDVMNTYARTLAVEADDNPDDAVISLRLLQRNPGKTGRDEFGLASTANEASQGDELVFYNPRTGRILGYAVIKAIENGRFTLSNSIPGLDTWELGDGRGATLVYNTQSAARFFIRDSRFMDSMRLGIFIKANGGAVFNTQFEGLASAAILGCNEPGWPEGPFPYHLWFQGNIFNENNYGYASRNRVDQLVDPANVSIYAARLPDSSNPRSIEGRVAEGEYPCSHLRISGNVFRSWRGMGISVRNARNVHIRDNLFLPPIEDPVVRRKLADIGSYAGIFLDTVSGAIVAGNRFSGLPSEDRTVALGQAIQATDVREDPACRTSPVTPDIYLPFSEWFSNTSVEPASFGNQQEVVRLGAVSHVAGRLGAGLRFDGKRDSMAVTSSADIAGEKVSAFTIGLWVRPTGNSSATEVIYEQGNITSGLAIGIRDGRFAAGVWQNGKGVWLDLGQLTTDQWQHLAFVFDGSSRKVHGYVNGVFVAQQSDGVPAYMQSMTGIGAFGGVMDKTRLRPKQTVSSRASKYHGLIDEFVLFKRAVEPADIATIAMH